MIDTNVYLSRWPFRRLPDDNAPALAARLRGRGVTQAWAASFDALLHKDVAAVNARLAADCAAHGAGLLLPFGAVNPSLPGWREDLRRVHEQHRMPGIRLHPNYHGYQLDQPPALELLAEAARRGLLVQIAAAMEDERTQHPLMRVPPVNLAPLSAALASFPSWKLMVLNSPNSAPPLRGAYFDLAMRESPYAVSQLLASAGSDRVVFGSYSPFFYFESALLKLKESGLEGAQAQAVRTENAARLLAVR